MFLKERAAASERYQSTTGFERKKNVQHIVLLCVEGCVAASENILYFLMNVRLLLKIYLTTASERKKCAS